MNCKPGDLARVVRSVDGNRDKLVRVGWDSGRRDSGIFWWVAIALSPMNTAAGSLVAAGTQLYLGDNVLQPLRYSDGLDEMVRITGRPIEYQIRKHEEAMRAFQAEQKRKGEKQ